MEKQEIVSELYSIRAGLSLISENLDIAQQAQEKKGTMKKTVNSRIDEYHRAQVDLPQLQKRKQVLLSEKEKLDEKKAACVKKITSLSNVDKEVERCDVMRKVRSEFFPDGDSLLPTILINALYWFIGFWFSLFVFAKITTAISNDSAEYRILLGIVDIILALGVYPAVLAIVYAIRKKGLIEHYTKQLYNDRDKILKTHQSEKNKIVAEIAQIEKELEELTQKENKYALIQQNYWTEVGELTKRSEANDAVCDRIVDHCIQENDRIRNCLINNYNSILTIADWPNIDLVIFYFNTGRADTLKEALQLVDEQKRNDAIIHAIGSASREISNTIQRNFNNLSSMLSSHFSRINMQIEDMSFRMDKLGDAVGEATTLLGGQISKLTEANRLQMAFMKKAAKSTADLVDDMNRSTEVKIAINY